MKLTLGLILLASLISLLDCKGGTGSSGGSRGGSTGSRGSGSRTSGGSLGGSKTRGKTGGIRKALGSNKVRAGLAGLAAGYLTYRAGKAILNAGSHFGEYNGYRYYWGNNYYNQYGLLPFTGLERGGLNGGTMCQYNLGSRDGKLGSMFYPDQTPVRMLVFNCPRIILLVFCCCCCGVFFVLYKFFRSLLDCCLGPSNDQQAPKFDDVQMAPAQPANYPTYAPQQNPYTNTPNYAAPNYPPPQDAPYPASPNYNAPPPAYGFN